MKKTIAIILLIIIMACTSCNSLAEPQDSLRKAINIEYEEIESIVLLDNQGQELKITDHKDYKFLDKYAYKNDYTDLSDIYVFPKVKRGWIEIKGQKENISIFILETGNIVYGSDEKNSLKEYSTGRESSKEIFDLYKKYGGIIN